MTSRVIKKKAGRAVVVATEENICEIPAIQAGVLVFLCTVSYDMVNEWLCQRTTADVKDFVMGMSNEEFKTLVTQMGKVANACGTHSMALAADYLKPQYAHVKDVMRDQIATFAILKKTLYDRKRQISRAWSTMHKGANTLQELMDMEANPEDGAGGGPPNDAALVLGVASGVPLPPPAAGGGAGGGAKGGVDGSAKGGVGGGAKGGVGGGGKGGVGGGGANPLAYEVKYDESPEEKAHVEALSIDKKIEYYTGYQVNLVVRKDKTKLAAKEEVIRTEKELAMIQEDFNKHKKPVADAVELQKNRAGFLESAKLAHEFAQNYLAELEKE